MTSDYDYCADRYVDYVKNHYEESFVYFKESCSAYLYCGDYYKCKKYNPYYRKAAYLYKRYRYSRKYGKKYADLVDLGEYIYLCEY